jgi:hypothetical protein
MVGGSGLVGVSVTVGLSLSAIVNVAELAKGSRAY